MIAENTYGCSCNRTNFRCEAMYIAVSAYSDSVFDQAELFRWLQFLWEEFCAWLDSITEPKRDDNARYLRHRIDMGRNPRRTARRRMGYWAGFL